MCVGGTALGMAGSVTGGTRTVGVATGTGTGGVAPPGRETVVGMLAGPRFDGLTTVGGWGEPAAGAPELGVDRTAPPAGGDG